MEKLLFILYFLTFCTPSVLIAQKAQNQECQGYKCNYEKAKIAFKQEKFKDALDLCKAAKAYPDANIMEADDLIYKVFAAIEAQRNAIEAQRKLAEENLKKSVKLISYFDFNKKVKRAWAYRNSKFAIIDLDGNLIKAKDSLGKVLGDFIFDTPLPFNDLGFAIVQKDGFYYTVNTQGVISDPYNYFMPCNNGWFKVKKGDKYSFLDKNGKPTAFDWFEEINNFNNDLAFFKERDNYGIINSDGSIVYQSELDMVDLHDDLFNYNNKIYNLVSDQTWVKKNNQWGLLDDKMEFIIDAEFDEKPVPLFGHNIKSNLFLIKKNSYYGFMSLDKKIYVHPKFEIVNTERHKNNYFIPVIKKNKTKSDYDAYLHNEDEYNIKTKYLIARNKEQSGLIDTLGNTIIDFNYDELEHLSNDFYQIKQGEYYGIIKLENDKIIPIADCKYEAIILESPNICLIRLGEYWGFINLNTYKKIEPQFENSYGNYFSKNRARIIKEKLIGIIDTNLNIIVPPKFEEIGSDLYENGNIFVKFKHKWQIYNTNSKSLIKNILFDSINYYSLQNESSYVEVFNNRKCGLVDSFGKILVPIKFDSLIFNTGKNDYVWTVKGKQIGLYNMKFNKEVFSPKFDITILKFYEKQRTNADSLEHCYYFQNNFACVNDGSNFFIIDTLGNRKYTFSNLEELKFDKNRCYFKDGGVLGFIDSSGYVFKDYKKAFDKIGLFNEGLAIVEKDDKKGWIDEKGEIKIPLKYKDVYPFQDGLAQVVTYQNSKGWLKLNNMYHIEPKYKEIKNYYGNDTALVNLNGDWGWLNYRTKEYIIEPQFSNVLLPSKWGLETESLYIVEKYEKYGLVNLKSIQHIVLMPEYDSIRQVSRYDLNYLENDNNRYFRLIKNKKVGLSDQYGRMIFLPSANEIITFYPIEGLAINKLHGKRGVIDSTGKQVVPPQFDDIRIYPNNICRIEQSGSYGLYDITQNKISVPLIYKEITYDNEGNYWKATKTIAGKDEVFHIDSQGLIIVNNPNLSVLKGNKRIRYKPVIPPMPPPPFEKKH